MCIRNAGKTTVTYSFDALGKESDIEIDGVWHAPGPAGGNFALQSSVAPGGVSEMIRLSLSSSSLERTTNGETVIIRNLNLKPGKHSVRVRTPGGSMGIHDSAHRPIVLVSNAITIEIPDLTPADEKQALIEQASTNSPESVPAAQRLVLKYPDVLRDAIEKWRNTRLLMPSRIPDASDEGNLIMFLAKCGSPRAIDALHDVAQSPVDVRLAVVKAFLPPRTDPDRRKSSYVGAGGANYAGGVSNMINPEIALLPGGTVGAAIDRLLGAALDDKGQRVGLTGAYDEFSYIDPGVCDIAALVISRRWPQKYHFTWAASPIERDAQITLIRSAWARRASL